MDQCIILFYVCFSLKMPYLIYIIDSLIWTSQPVALSTLPTSSAATLAGAGSHGGSKQRGWRTEEPGSPTAQDSPCTSPLSVSFYLSFLPVPDLCSPFLSPSLPSLSPFLSLLLSSTVPPVELPSAALPLTSLRRNARTLSSIPYFDCAFSVFTCSYLNED